MWNFKSCPRCKGDLFIDEDQNRCYEKCLQCGYERELIPVGINHSGLMNSKKKRA